VSLEHPNRKKAACNNEQEAEAGVAGQVNCRLTPAARAAEGKRRLSVVRTGLAIAPSSAAAPIRVASMPNGSGQPARIARNTLSGSSTSRNSSQYRKPYDSGSSQAGRRTHSRNSNGRREIMRTSLPCAPVSFTLSTELSLF
jgi:hypothetical protein